MKRIFITGGHFAPALATIQELKDRGGWDIFYIGRRFAMEDDKAEALEYTELKKIPGLTYLIITSGRLQPKFFVNIFQSVKSLLKVFIGLCQALIWILKFHPDVVLSFGGYVAIPIVSWAWLLGIPIATHEQTIGFGRANRLIAKLADRILVSWPETANHYHQNKVVLTGNPLRREIIAVIRQKKAPSPSPTIYITGGNQGAHVINEAVKEVLPQLLSSYELIHQTGDAKKLADFAALEEEASKLPEELRQNYHLAKFFDAQQVAKALWQSDLVITRAGANITTELLALGKPALFIPIPWSEKQEQMENAKYIRRLQLAEILPQEKLTGSSLLDQTREMVKNLDRYKRNISQAKETVPLDAASRIVDEVKGLIVS